MYKKIKLLAIGAVMLFSQPMMAQSSGDKLYSQGLELQKKQTVASQKSAIAKFQSAKKLYDSAAKKKQCDDAIAVSQSIIKSINSNKGGRSNAQAGRGDNLKTSALELSNEYLKLDDEQRTVTVNVTSTESEWSITPIANNDGVAFVSINQHPESNSFEISCTANTSTRSRMQTIEVRAGEMKKKVVVQQSGKPIILSVENAVVEFSSKGGSKSVEVYCNSDDTEEDNNNRNWKVVSKPDWANVIGEEYKEKGFFAKISDKAKELVKKGSASAEDPSVVISVMKLVVASKPKSAPSRSGEIVIGSGNQQATIIIQQN